jgi:hypothetical protein
MASTYMCGTQLKKKEVDMTKTRIFQVNQLQQDFLVGGVFNNKLIGSWDLNPTNKDWSRPSWMEIKANSTPVSVTNMAPFTPNYWGDLSARVLCQTFRDNACGVSTYKAEGAAFPGAKAALYKDITTNPKVILCEDPIGPKSTGYVAAGLINEFGVYGSYMSPDPDNPRALKTSRVHWDFDGKIISKNHDYVAITAAGPLNQSWVDANFTAPSGWIVAGFSPIKQFVLISLNKLNDDGTANKDFNGFAILDPTGVAPDRFCLPTGPEWRKARALSVSDDMRYCTFAYIGYNATNLKWDEGARAFDFETEQLYDLKVILGLDPWTAYKCVDADFTETNGLVCTSLDVVKDSNGATVGMSRNLDLLTDWM